MRAGNGSPLSDRRPDLPPRLVQDRRWRAGARSGTPVSERRGHGARSAERARTPERAGRDGRARGHHSQAPSDPVCRRAAVRESRTRPGPRVLLQRPRGGAPDGTGQGAGTSCRLANIVRLTSTQTETDIRNHLPAARRRCSAGGHRSEGRRPLRISAQLVSAEDGCHLWSEGYDRRTADVFAVQDEIARSVVDRLKVTLAEFPRQPLIRQHTQNPRAYQCYLKGRFYWTRRYHGGLKAALEQFQKAIEEDAGYALAYAGLADAYSFMAVYSVQRPRTAFAHRIGGRRTSARDRPRAAGGAHVAGIHQASGRLELAGSRTRVPPRAGRSIRPRRCPGSTIRG